MSKDANRSLGKWLLKAKDMPAPPKPTVAPGNLQIPELPAPRLVEALQQLNLKIPNSTYRRIKALAHRDHTTLLAMLEEMLDLYEREHGSLKAP